MPTSTISTHTIPSLILRSIYTVVAAAALCVAGICAAQAKPAAPGPGPDELVLSNGDTLHGKFVSEISGKVTFQSDALGDVTLGWDKIKEMHVTESVGVLDGRVKTRGKHRNQQIPVGALDVQNEEVDVHTANAAAPLVIPEKSALYVMDSATLDKQMNHEPSFFAGWNGAASAGATIVSATENQYTFTGTVGLVRTVPTVSWLDPRNKTSVAVNESYGKITQPAYTYIGTGGPTPVPSVVTESSITHVAAERDEYFTSRVYALGEVSFDHNFAQELALQQIFGGGFGWTAMKSPKHELDLTGTVQYEEQRFFPGSGSANQNLIGSTFAANYVLKLKRLTYTQALALIPAYNRPTAYSAAETDSLAFPTYKNLGFSVGTIDTYLNDAPFIGTATSPPTKPNSFQFTTGLTYAFKSKY
ncbi:MAG: DUF481 domain-containing protein [Terracidiphilus sp.]